MEIKGTKTLDLVPIGDIAFIWSNRSRRKGTKVLHKDIYIKTETALKISSEDLNELHRIMKLHGSEVLTDGKKLYSTFDKCIMEIDGSFRNVIKLYGTENNNY